jgi:hypothetical protein
MAVAADLKVKQGKISPRLSSTSSFTPQSGSCMRPVCPVSSMESNKGDEKEVRTKIKCYDNEIDALIQQKQKN